MSPGKLTLPLIIGFLLFFGAPQMAGATQFHPPEEGVYAHQIGHFAFIISMGILIYWLRRRGLTKESGWKCIQFSAFFFILWNIDAAVVHQLEDREDLFEILQAGQWNRWIHVLGDHQSLSLLYYIGRLDHLLCVPAIFLLYLGLRKLLRNPGKAGFPEQRA